VSPLVELLVRLRALLERVPDSVYTARPVPQLSGSIGEHVRHCLDHVATLATAPGAHRLSYDQRTRSTSDETSKQVAIARIDRLTDELVAMSDLDFEGEVTVTALLHKDGLPMTAPSSLARELAFVVNHTLHHFAVIALLLDRMGVKVPAQFAHAPSTLKAA
jgi:uncharacterized damage-inducible protein DinB